MRYLKMGIFVLLVAPSLSNAMGERPPPGDLGKYYCVLETLGTGEMNSTEELCEGSREFELSTARDRFEENCASMRVEYPTGYRRCFVIEMPHISNGWNGRREIKETN